MLVQIGPTSSKSYLAPNTQGDTLDEAKSNLDEAIALVLDANRALAEELIAGQEVIREAVSLSAA